MTARPIPLYEFYPPRRQVPRTEREPAMIPPFKIKHPNRRRKQTRQITKSAIADLPTGMILLGAAFVWFLALAGY